MISGQRSAGVFGVIKRELRRRCGAAAGCVVGLHEANKKGLEQFELAWQFEAERWAPLQTLRRSLLGATKQLHVHDH